MKNWTAFYDAHHTAVLRMIYQTVQNAHKENIWCGICGELGGDTELTRLFLAMGVDELSVSPGKVLPLRKIIRETRVEEDREKLLQTVFIKYIGCPNPFFCVEYRERGSNAFSRMGKGRNGNSRGKRKC